MMRLHPYPSAMHREHRLADPTTPFHERGLLGIQFTLSSGTLRTALAQAQPAGPAHTRLAELRETRLGLADAHVCAPTSRKYD